MRSTADFVGTAVAGAVSFADGEVAVFTEEQAEAASATASAPAASESLVAVNATDRSTNRVASRFPTASRLPDPERSVQRPIGNSVRASEERPTPHWLSRWCSPTQQ